ncbi:hypothetical protein ACFOEM_02285 [Paenalcaligenes hominis]|uniref:hypothetical protein n=1 Tax=Paenalcaligenes hominis TaxID=643674 RepID=UPI00360E12AD
MKWNAFNVTTLSTAPRNPTRRLSKKPNSTSSAFLWDSTQNLAIQGGDGSLRQLII